ncbi:hypothetical protein OKW42_003805 [Paraburkholderia sp. WC7.3d]
MMAQFDPADRQASIAAEMHIAAEFDANREIERRVDFLAHYLRSSHLKTYVLGISGGVDSTTAGRLAQLAVARLRANHYDARFVAVRLPYGKQRDEADAQQALRFIRADENVTIDIKRAADAMLESLDKSGVSFADESQRDFVHGNIAGWAMKRPPTALRYEQTRWACARRRPCAPPSKRIELTAWPAVRR